MAEAADAATSSASAILKQEEEITKKLYEIESGNGNYQKMLDMLFEQFLVKRTDVAELLGVSNSTAVI